MNKILDRYKVDCGGRESIRFVDLFFLEEALRIAALASKDVRDLLGFIGRQSNIIKAQRETIKQQQAELDRWRTSPPEDYYWLKTQLRDLRIKVQELTLKLKVSRQNFVSLEAESDAQIRIERNNASVLWSEIVNSNDMWRKKAQWAAAWKRIAKKMWPGFYDDGWKDVFDKMDALEAERDDLVLQRDAAWQELRLIREAARPDCGQSTLDAVRALTHCLPANSKDDCCANGQCKKLTLCHSTKQGKYVFSEQLKSKIIEIASQLCRMHGHVAGSRVCQDWSDETTLLDSLTDEEKDILSFIYEQYNSNGEEYETGYFPYDEMLISFIIARALEIIAGKE